MKISKIIVENYRSIKKEKILPDKLSVFVGQNNHGKTNLFEAIEWFYNAKSSKEEQHFNKDKSNTIKVEIFFEDVVESDTQKIRSNANRTKILNLLNGETKFSVSLRWSGLIARSHSFASSKTNLTDHKNALGKNK